MIRRPLLLLVLGSLVAGCAGILGIEELSGDAGVGSDGGKGDASMSDDSSTADAADGSDARDSGASDSGDSGELDAGDSSPTPDGAPDSGCAVACTGTTPFCVNGTCAANPPSCTGTADAGLTNCGPNTESCCTSLLVDAGADGGTFLRSYDAVTYTDASAPATVSSFRLDKYEVTVGRFRQFVNAVVNDHWLPSDGSGKHTHLNGGMGLRTVPGTYELGWDVANNVPQILPGTFADWRATTSPGLFCDSTYQTWTPTPAGNENLPIDCATWFEAYAFCIWDGGFLPSTAEWNFAAAGGGGPSGQRAYPWSVPSTDETITCSYANYDPSTPCVAAGFDAVGSESPAGDGAFGQADLTGNVWEWNFDAWADYVTPCVNCANIMMGGLPLRILRGGARDATATQVLVSATFGWGPSASLPTIGFRCARVP